MQAFKVFVEVGKVKTFAGTLDWPDWCRGTQDENLALGTLINYGPRYAEVMNAGGMAFQAPEGVRDLIVVERHDGNTTTVLGPPRYFIRRVAWHVLDHAWEIEDRIN